MLSLQSFLRKGEVFAYVGAKLKPKGPTGPKGPLFPVPVSAYGGGSKNLKDLKDLIRKEAWLFCRTSSGVRLCWELEGPKIEPLAVPSTRASALES